MTGRPPDNEELLKLGREVYRHIEGHGAGGRSVRPIVIQLRIEIFDRKQKLEVSSLHDKKPLHGWVFTHGVWL